MSLQKSKELLIEVIGEERFIEFENGFPIKMKDPNNYNYWITKKEWGLNLQRMSPEGQLTEGMIKATRHELYDSAASFLTGVILGKVDWRCGNIPVKLPKEMPRPMPRNLSVTRYILESLIGIGSGTKQGILGFPSWVKTNYLALAEEVDNTPGGFVWTYLFGGLCVLFVPGTLLSFIVMIITRDIDFAAAFWAIGGFVIAGPINAFILHYLNWRMNWMEVQERT